MKTPELDSDEWVAEDEQRIVDTEKSVSNILVTVDSGRVVEWSSVPESVRDRITFLVSNGAIFGCCRGYYWNVQNEL